MLNYLKKLFALIILSASLSAISEVPIPTDSRIKTYVYNENDVYSLIIQSGFQSSIEFSKGETIQTISLGDSYSWNISPVGNRLFIKPVEDNIRTNMTVITNKKTYQFDLVSRSVDESDSDVAYVVRFYYPKDEPAIG